ncbi:MAG TPA: adenosylhomocysteinase [Candidatus Aenigmarchaeota archaeon]|nr:adenosylhomocysteinase [Candidatus Aenigmarchaeota archaeon]
MDYKVKDISLAEKGKLQIEWAEKQMPVLMKIREEFKKKKPFEGLTICAALHITKETAVLMKTLKAGGARVALAAANPLSTQDEVAAALAEEGIHVFAWAGESKDEYYWCINKVLDFEPDITLDDGGDLVSTIHSKRQELLEKVKWGQEETTTGVIRLRAMEKKGTLKYPVVAVNDTPVKRLFDNYYGTAQSTLDGIMRATNIMIAGKTFVVCGYGHCGSGLANKARGMGANVIVVEVDPIKALRAVMDGFRVMPMREAAKVGDVFVTVTGDKDVIRKEHFELMKDGAILANAGHFNVEISIPDLESISKSKRTIRKNVEEYTLKDGRKLYLLAQGRIVNLVAAEGHPSSVMDQSFSIHALCCEHFLKIHDKLEPKVYNVPEEIDRRVAELKLQSMGVEIEKLTEEQKAYLESWELGTE